MPQIHSSSLDLTWETNKAHLRDVTLTRTGQLTSANFRNLIMWSSSDLHKAYKYHAYIYSTTVSSNLAICIYDTYFMHSWYNNSYHGRTISLFSSHVHPVGKHQVEREVLDKGLS